VIVPGDGPAWACEYWSQHIVDESKPAVRLSPGQKAGNRDPGKQPGDNNVMLWSLSRIRPDDDLFLKNVEILVSV
jgi:hypothetical protein